MKEERTTGPLRAFSRVVIKLVLFACVLIVAIAVVGYAAGWIEFRHDTEQDKATIEIEVGEAKETAERAVEKARALVDEVRTDVGEQRDEPVEAAPPEASKSAADDASASSYDNEP